MNLFRNRRRGTAFAVLSVFVALVAVLLWRNSLEIYDRDFSSKQGISNSRQIQMALFEFENEFGDWPNVTTITSVQNATRTNLRLGDRFSNDFFRQLLAVNPMDESMFQFASSKLKKPVENLGLEKGTCNLAYVIAPGSDSFLPILFGPVIPGEKKFDRQALNGTVVVCRRDGSITALKIDAEGRVFYDGINLLDPLNPIWNGICPEIFWPE